MSKKIKKQNNLKRVIIGIVVLIIVIVLLLVVKNFTKKDDNTKTSLIINNNNVTSRLKNEVLIEDNTIYLSEADVKNFFDKYLYEDEKNNQLVTTYEKKIATLNYEEKQMIVNGSAKTLYRGLLEKDEVTYLPISEMNDVYDIEITYIQETNTITMDSLDRGQERAYAAKNISVKSKASVFSKTLDKIGKGNWAIVITETEDGWTKVRSANGKIGFVKTNKLTNYVTVREDMEDENQETEKVSLVWDYYSEYAKAPDRSSETIEGINVVSPSFFSIDEDGEFDSNVGTAGTKYISWAKENNYEVWPMVSNAESTMDKTSEIMNDYNKRQELIENIVDVCVEYNLEGINIDFENMYKEDKDMYSRFIIELVPRMKEIGIKTSVDVTAPDGSDTWSLCFDRNVIGDVADYIVFMAYDQYGNGSKKAGTTAGYNWIETSLKKFLETEEIESNKIILGIPFYTRLWTESGENVTSSVVNIKDVDSAISSSAEKVWDDTLKQYYVEYTQGNSTKKMWIEDEESIKAKLSLISQYNLGGAAFWEKDRESDGIWSLVKEALQ